MAVEVLGTLADKIVPARCALLVVDMENDFVHPSGKTATRGKRPLDHIHAIVPHIRSLIDGARAAGAHVVHVQHTTLRDGLSDSGPWLEARRRARYSADDVCLEGTWGHEIIDELRPAPGEAIVRKYRYGAFVGTSLDLVLRSLGVRTTICCGASTNVCVEATAREAFGHDYYVVLPREACGSWDAALHEATLTTAGYRYAEVCSVADILEVWRG
jgi:ureidoacrylate peracid hydrolase